MQDRANARVSVDRSVFCVAFSGDERIKVSDLSTSGCMISRSQGRWTRGETIVIGLVGDVQIAGEIVWERELSAGVRFTSELPERIVAFLGFNSPARRSKI